MFLSINDFPRSQVFRRFDSALIVICQAGFDIGTMADVVATVTLTLKDVNEGQLYGAQGQAPSRSMVGGTGLEPVTSAMSTLRSNQLS